jgi:hypothetical protein
VWDSLSATQAPPLYLMGRPTKLTPELQAEYLAALKRTWYVETAAELVGLPSWTVRRWLRQGRDEPDSVYGAFRVAVKGVLAREEAHHREVVAKAEQWQAHAWLLERRHPDRWDNWRKEFRAMKRELEELRARYLAQDAQAYRDAEAPQCGKAGRRA